MRLLQLGSGEQKDRDHLFRFAPIPVKEDDEIISIDINPTVKPTIVYDLSQGLPPEIEESSIDIIIAQEVLEHLNYQGDYQAFFREFSDYWRVLKPDGCMLISCPSLTSPWKWGDPGHKRIISQEMMVFLNQEAYKQCDRSPMTDYRFCYKADFELMTTRLYGDNWVRAMQLRCVKPSRIKV